MKFIFQRRPKTKPKVKGLAQAETDGIPETISFMWYEAVGLLFSICSYILDTYLDIVVAWNHYDDGKMWYFGLTVAFVVIPSLVMTFFSLKWYIADSKDPKALKVSPRLWAVRIVLLIIQLGPVLRYFDSLRFGMLFRREKGRDYKKAKTYYKQMTFEDADAGILRLFEAFMEAAPQLLLQIYIMAQTDHDQPTTTILFQFGSCVTSLLSLSWALASQQRSQRFSQAKKKNPSWPATIMQYIWYLLVTYSRMLTLGLFASRFPKVFGIVCACRFAVMTVWLQTMKTNFCDTAPEEIFYKCVLGVVFLFCYVNPENTPTRWRYLFYYLYTFTENSVLIAVWYVAVGPEVWFKVPAIMSVFLTFAIGICFMVVYYLYFHPSEEIQVFGWPSLRSKCNLEDQELQDLPSAVERNISLPHDVEVSHLETELEVSPVETELEVSYVETEHIEDVPVIAPVNSE